MKRTWNKRTSEDRFFDKVNKDGPTPKHIPDLGKCWVWTAGKTRRGYGQFRYVFNGNIHFRAHRVSWIIHNGSIPEHLFVLHKCDNPACVNPTHLFLGTAQDNENDKKQKNRQAKGKTHWCAIHPEKIKRGEDNPYAKLSEIDVFEIRKLRKKNLPVKELMKMYKVSNTLIYLIEKRKVWTHI